MFALPPITISYSEHQIQSSTKNLKSYEWSFDSNIRKRASPKGMRMLESDHSCALVMRRVLGADDGHFQFLENQKLAHLFMICSI
jgi:hypothetical protein